jgi:hypothetical protein
VLPFLSWVKSAVAAAAGTDVAAVSGTRFAHPASNAHVVRREM